MRPDPRREPVAPAAAPENNRLHCRAPPSYDLRCLTTRCDTKRGRFQKLHPIVIALLWLSAAGGCQPTKVDPPPVPTAAIGLDYYIGDPLSGPQAGPQPVSLRPEDVLALHVSIISLEKIPDEQVLSPLAGSTRFIAVTRGGVPMRPVPGLTRGARLGLGDAATGVRAWIAQSAASRSAIEMQSIDAAVPMAATAVVAVTESGTAGAARRLAIEVHRPSEAPDSLQMALVVDDWMTAGAPADDANDAPAPPAAPMPTVLQRERVLLDPLRIVEPQQAALIVPFSFADNPRPAIAFLIEAAPGSQDASHVQAVEQCAVALRRSTEEAIKRPGDPPIRSDDIAGVDAALRALSMPAQRQAAMLFLTSQTGARFCAEVSLVADDAIANELAERIAGRAGSSAPQSLATLGWVLDLAALELLSELSSSGKLPSELSSVLILHCGQSGRDPASLEQAIRGAGSRSDFDKRLIAENLVFLEDSSPAARVRAFDWLQAHNAAPPGYDPLADNRQRRDALERALNPEAQPPSTQPIHP